MKLTLLTRVTAAILLFATFSSVAAIPFAPPTTVGATATATAVGRYTVKRGDTLTRLAKKFKTTVSAIKAANGLTSNTIRIGQVLIIPNGATTSSPTATLAPTGVPTSAAAGGPRIGNCPVFPLDNAWNTDISSFSVHPNSANFIARIGSGNLHPGFGDIYGIPFNTVPGTQPRVPISFYYPDESDPGPYPIPSNPAIEGGGDRHILVIDGDNCLLYEVYDAQPSGSGWAAGSGAIWNLKINAARPPGWTSADAAGLPIFPGLVRYDEVVEKGEINHALRFTVTRTQRAYIAPASHFASSDTNPSLPPMGLRLRLKSNFDISGFNPQAQVILRALKKYGMIVADNGSNWLITGGLDPRWNNEILDQLKTVSGSSFEAVYTGPTSH